MRKSKDVESIAMFDWFSRESKSKSDDKPGKIAFQAHGNVIVTVTCADKQVFEMLPEPSPRQLSNLGLIDRNKGRLLEILLDEAKVP